MLEEMEVGDLFFNFFFGFLFLVFIELINKTKVSCASIKLSYNWIQNI